MSQALQGGKQSDFSLCSSSKNLVFLKVSSEEPHHHFKSVCRDMVKEVEDLSSLMSRMGREELQELEEEERRNLLGVFSTVSDCIHA